MEYNIYEKDNCVIVENVEDFDLKHIFDCGQSFRWYEENDSSYTGVAKEKVINIKKNSRSIIISNSDINDFTNIWYEYLDMDRDYSKVKEKLAEDEVLKEAIKFGEGIRILKQDPWEILISFIISANNRIPMIKRAIRSISEKWGKPVQYNGETYYTFPGPEELSYATVEELEKCSTGFRAKYIKKTTEMILRKDIELYNLKNYSYEEAKSELMKLPGVGPKVSDCILLFSMGQYKAFPVDVWVKRIMQYLYLAPDVSLMKIEKYAHERFGELGGFAQQYLFYYAREFKGKDIII